MKNNSLEVFPIPEKNIKDSCTLLENCGFSPNFFYDLEKNALMLGRCPIKKIKSANDIKLLQKQGENIKLKKIYEAEDKDIFNNKNNELKNNIYLNYNSHSSNNNFSSYTTISSQDYLHKNIYDIYNQQNKYVINAYKSKHKKKYSKLYEINSITLKEKNKYKLFHKCCYPGCNRTFSSSGWLKAHLKDHLNQIHNSKYCKLFDKYILAEKIKSLNNKKNSFYNNNNNTKNNSNINLENNCNNINIDNTSNKFLFFSRINSQKSSFNFFENNSMLKIDKNPFSLYHFNNDTYKGNF